jgi:hypothetical protein
VLRHALCATAIGCLVASPLAQQQTTIAGRISRPDGTPAADVQVFASIRDGRGGLHPVARGVTEWDGRYRLAGLAAGRYVVGARATPQSPPTYYPNDLEPARDVALFAGVPAEGIDIWLQPLPRRHTVSGRLHWPSSREVQNVMIEYGGPANPHKGIWYVSDPGGLFTIENVPPGTMVMLARADTDAGPLIGLASTEVSVAGVEEVAILLEPPGSIDGRIAFERPLPAGVTVSRVVLTHALLQVSSIYPAEAGTVDATGRFRIDSARGVYSVGVDGLPPGWAVRRVRQGGRNVARDRVTVGPGATATVELFVGPAGR